MASQSLISRFPHFDDRELQHLSLEREIFNIQTENRFKAYISILI